MFTASIRTLGIRRFPRCQQALKCFGFTKGKIAMTHLLQRPAFQNNETIRPLSTSWRTAATGDLVSAIKQKNGQSKVVIYSRSWCPFCAEVLKLFASYNISPKVIDLDGIVEGDDIQDALSDITDISTVPQVFVDGKFIGGCDDTYALHNQGKLKPLLED